MHQIKRTYITTSGTFDMRLSSHMSIPVRMSIGFSESDSRRLTAGCAESPKIWRSDDTKHRRSRNSHKCFFEGVPPPLPPPLPLPLFGSTSIVGVAVAVGRAAGRRFLASLLAPPGGGPPAGKEKKDRYPFSLFRLGYWRKRPHIYVC